MPHDEIDRRIDKIDAALSNIQPRRLDCKACDGERQAKVCRALHAAKQEAERVTSSALVRK